MTKNDFKARNGNLFLNKGFSLVEVIVAIALVGGVLSMIMGAVVILDRAVANERTVVFNPPTGSIANWGYQDINAFPAFSLAPSRLADAQAQSLWRQIHELYEQSYAVGAINAYLIFNPTSNTFEGNSGYLSGGFHPLNKSQLTALYLSPAGASTDVNDPRNSLQQTLLNRFPSTFQTWDASTCGNIDRDPVNNQHSLRTSTVFFLGTPNDRILGILRMRSWQFTDSTSPYRYYEVNLIRFNWDPNSPVAANGVDRTWQLVAGTNIVEDFSYRFMEDRRFPQDLIFPPTAAELAGWSGDTNGGVPLISLPVATGAVVIENTSPVNYLQISDATPRDSFIRCAPAGEDYALLQTLNLPVAGTWANNVNPGVSRQQVSLTPVDNTILNDNASATLPALRAPVDEWHLILPDPSLTQSEDRAALRNAQGTNFSATLDTSFRRQGKYGCAFSVYP